MIEDYTIHLYEDKIHEYEDVWPARIKRTHYPLNGPYNGPGQKLLSFSPGNLASFPIFGDVKVFHLSLYGNADNNEDDREAWADPIRFEVLRRLRHQDWNWYIAADGWAPYPTNPGGHIPLDRHLQNLFAKTHSIQSIPVRSFPAQSGKMVAGHWVWTSEPSTRTFFEIPFPLIGDAASVIWSNASPGIPIEGYQMPQGSLNLLRQWGNEPLDEKLFRQVIDACSVVFYTWPAEHRRFAFLTNKWSLSDLQAMLDIPDLQNMADQIKAQLEE